MSSSWPTCSKTLDLITDPDAYLMLETNLRGGIATISKRYASANNNYVEGYNNSEESRYITYIDANSLYVTAQSQHLPVGNFRFLDEIEIEKFSLDSIAADAIKTWSWCGGLGPRSL